MGSVVGVVLLILADIGLPPQASLVDCLDQQISFIGWLVLQMEVPTLSGSLLGLMVLLAQGGGRRSAVAQLNQVGGFARNILEVYFVVLHNLIELHFTCVVSLCLLDIIMLFLDGLEALNGVLSHRERFSSFLWNVLDKTNHSL
jgi:hypothetical protein